ncbi:MAG: hypothetical protein Q8K85_03965 [Hyphomicrobium sp.]|nr:hypothetical protein [Hyphomicrobium sp.]
MSAALDAAVRTAGCHVGQRSDEVRLGMARSVIAAAGRGERDPVTLQRLALAGVEASLVSEVLPYPPYSLPVAHRYSA